MTAYIFNTEFYRCCRLGRDEPEKNQKRKQNHAGKLTATRPYYVLARWVNREGEKMLESAYDIEIFCHALRTTSYNL